jgi:acyl-CoA thioesterase-1
MPIADRQTYLDDVTAVLNRHWPDNRTVNVACHGHSVPAGYFATPMVDTLHAYPHLLHEGLKQRFPFAVVNVIVTAIGGESSDSGAQRFGAEVLCHRPDVITIDYGLNDRRLGLARARSAWASMIEAALARGIKVLLLTPTADNTQRPRADPAEWRDLQQHAAQIRALAGEYAVGLVDSLVAFEQYVQQGGDLSDLLSWSNHPNRAGHEIVARELLRWFPVSREGVLTGGGAPSGA